MYHVSAQGIDEHTVNVHYYYCKLLGVLAAHKPLFFNNVFRLAPQCSPVLATQKPLLFNIQTVSTVFTSTGSPETSIFQHSDCLHRNTSTGNPETSIVQRCLETVSTETPVLATQKPLLFNIQTVSTETPVLATQKPLLFNGVLRLSKRSTSR